MSTLAVISAAAESQEIALRPNRARALELIGTTGGSLPAPTAASAIADITRDSIAAAIPYASGGGIEADLSIDHHAADGSRTSARLSFKFKR